MPEYLRVSEYAQLRGVTPKTVRRWCDDGRLDYILTAGGHRLIDRSAPLRPRSVPPAGSTTPSPVPSSTATSARRYVNGMPHEPEAVTVARYEAIRPADEARAAVAVQEAALARMRLQREAVELQRQYDREDRELEAAEQEVAEAEARAVREQHAAQLRAAANAKRVANLRALASIVYVPFDLPEAKREVARFIAQIDGSMDESVCDDIRAIVRRHQDAADTERRRHREAKAAADRIELCVSWATSFTWGETVKRAMDGAWDVTRSSDAVRAVERAVRSECRPDTTYSEVVAVAARVLDAYARGRIRGL
jgi:excisionase family DNA binding protein